MRLVKFINNVNAAYYQGISIAIITFAAIVFFGGYLFFDEINFGLKVLAFSFLSTVLLWVFLGVCAVIDAAYDNRPTQDIEELKERLKNEGIDFTFHKNIAHEVVSTAKRLEKLCNKEAFSRYDYEKARCVFVSYCFDKAARYMERVKKSADNRLKRIEYREREND